MARVIRSDKSHTGRPSKYKPEYAKELLDFFSTTHDRIINEDGTIEVIERPFPTLARFAGERMLVQQTLADWATAVDENGKLVNPEFSAAYNAAKQIQESRLVEGALSGKYQQTFAIFAAKNLFGWRDKVETEITGAGGAAAGIAIVFKDPPKVTDAGS